MAYGAWSEVAASTATLRGMWLADPTDPEGTVVRFPYGGVGRQHGLDRAKTAMQFVGRAYPVYDVGEARAETIQVSTTIPGDDIDAVAQYALARAIGENADIVLYRDGRGRKMYAMPSDWSSTDLEMGGYQVTFLLNRVDYDEALPGVS
jgi:hypothetical protein